MNLTNNQMELYAVAFCCGVGGQTLGLQQSENEYKGIKGNFKMLAGYDNDAVACKNYERVTGSKAVCEDLFTREQFILFHGKEPPPGWEELKASKVREQCGKTPDVVVMSPPCKGFSRLLPKKTAQLPKYQALNQLPERVFDLVLEAWFDDLPAILLMENVPGIRDKDRGRDVLKKIKTKLALRGYVFHEDLYDCGEWVAGQHRVRYLLIARLPSKVPDFVFQPPKLLMKSIGDILGPLPMPGDIEKGGKMHRIPNLAWRTWERLSLIPAGKDWRALENFGREQWKGAWRIVPWDEAANAVTSSTKGVGQSTGVSAVADPRKWSGAGNYGVMDWNEPAKTITASGDIHAGAAAVADPRIPGPDDRGIYIIIAADGTWHRPITTYEMAMLQGAPRTMRDGTPFELIDCSDGKAREYIGNMVPVQTATAIGNVLLETLMPNLIGDVHYGFSNFKIWVKGKFDEVRRYLNEDCN
ncbi:DNA cytosine methyltransferase [Ruminiclostridium josui]|uniref:DNA cytosine methyltransferase n=1 Tax=Ruminiclostridium josui TaxID=1499 RepID=UPI0006D163A4|nr:DNA cytosine methyltransferase [Ruminiclostridium josui]